MRIGMRVEMRQPVRFVLPLVFKVSDYVDQPGRKLLGCARPTARSLNRLHRNGLGGGPGSDRRLQWPGLVSHPTRSPSRRIAQEAC